MITLWEQSNICATCHAQLDRLTDKVCDYCSSPDHKLNTDCTMWKRKEVLAHNRSLYRYGPFLKTVMAQFKYRGDYELIHLFQSDVKYFFKKIYADLPGETVAVPIPLSQERLRERGFNQAEAIAQLTPFPVKRMLGRTTSEKQAKKSRKQRLQMKNPFKQIETTNTTSLLLIDDIYTTGATIHQAALTLKQEQMTIRSFTLAR